MERELYRAKARLYTIVGISIVAMFAFGAVFWHGYNVYPGFYASLAAKKMHGEKVWHDTCGSGAHTTVVSHELIKCSTAHEWAQINTFTAAVEETVKHVAGDLNFFQYIGCRADSLCVYWTWRVLELMVGSFQTLYFITAVVILALAYFYYKMYRSWQAIQRNQWRVARDHEPHPNDYLLHSSASRSSSVTIQEVNDDDDDDRVRSRHSGRPRSPPQIVSSPWVTADAHYPSFAAVKLRDLRDEGVRV